MEAANRFLDLKLETLQIIMALQDAAKLQSIGALLGPDEPWPQPILEVIKLRQHVSKETPSTPLEEYLAEIKDV